MAAIGKNLFGVCCRVVSGCFKKNAEDAAVNMAEDVASGIYPETNPESKALTGRQVVQKPSSRFFWCCGDSSEIEDYLALADLVRNLLNRRSTHLQVKANHENYSFEVQKGDIAKRQGEEILDCVVRITGYQPNHANPETSEKFFEMLTQVSNIAHEQFYNLFAPISRVPFETTKTVREIVFMLFHCLGEYKFTASPFQSSGLFMHSRQTILDIAKENENHTHSDSRLDPDTASDTDYFVPGPKEAILTLLRGQESIKKERSITKLDVSLVRALFQVAIHNGSNSDIKSWPPFKKYSGKLWRTEQSSEKKV